MERNLISGCAYKLKPCESVVLTTEKVWWQDMRRGRGGGGPQLVRPSSPVLFAACSLKLGLRIRTSGETDIQPVSRLLTLS